MLSRATLILLLLSYVRLSLAATPQRQFPDTSDGIFIYRDQLDSGMSEAQFKFAATRYAGTQKMTRDQARHLRQYNSNFLVLHYRLGQALGHSAPNNCQPTTNYIQIVDGNSWVQEWPGDSNVQENWFYHVNNQRVFNCAWGHYLAELNDPGWRGWWSGQVMQQLQDNEDDGVFADSYSVANYLGPWNPNLPTVDATFEQGWADREHSFSDYIQGQFNGQWKWIPNVGSWITTRDPSDYSNLNGFMIEGFAEGGNSNWYALGDWQLQMNRVVNLTAAGKILLAQTYPDSTNASERLFVLGSYLLVKGTQSYMNNQTVSGPEWYPEYDINLGPATDALPQNISTYFNSTWGVYVRHFAKGMVLVNPDTSVKSITLGGTFNRAVASGGGAVSSSGAPQGSLSFSSVTSLTLNAHEAAILLNPGPTNAAPRGVIVASPTSGIAPLQVAFDGSNSLDPDGSIASYSWMFGDGSAVATGATQNHTFTTAGTYTVTLTVTDNSGATSTARFNVLVQSNGADTPPMVTSTASATPNPATAGQSVLFSVAASDADGDLLSYAWNFGDGTSGSGAMTTKSYSAAGTYNTTVTITDGRGGSANSSVSVVVNSGSGSGGTGGTGGTGGGGNGGGSGSTAALTVTKLSGLVKFKAGGHDGCSLSGALPNVPAGFDPTNQSLTLNVGNASVAFTLDKNGHGKSSSGMIALKFKPSKRDKTTKKNVFQGGNVAFTAKLQNGTWAATWGMDPNATVSNSPRQMTATVQLGGTTYTASVTVMYSAKAGVMGKFKK